MNNRHANYVIVESETTPAALVIRDVGPWDQHPTITNDAENVVAELFCRGLLPDGRGLFYYDSSGDLAMLIHHHGEFLGFMPMEGDQL